MIKHTNTLVNQQNGDLAFRIQAFEDNTPFDHLQRHNYYTIILVTEGYGTLKADFSEYDFEGKTLFCFSPYQPYMLSIVENSPIKGIIINFHADFFCIYRHQNDIASEGVLFDNIYLPPFFNLDEGDMAQFDTLIGQLNTEAQRHDTAQQELLVLYLKIFLITAMRIRVKQQGQLEKQMNQNKEPFMLQKLKDAIEIHYKNKHTASDYAAMLHITAKALAKMVKNHFHKTLTDLIGERIIMEAKRELYLTSKPIKEIAYILGFNDEYYFSRFFKRNTDVSPQLYRDTVGFAKAEKLLLNAN